VALCLLGSPFSCIFLKSKKGAKVCYGSRCFFVLFTVAFLIAMLVFILCVCWFNRSSVGSLAAGAVIGRLSSGGGIIPFLCWMFPLSWSFLFIIGIWATSKDSFPGKEPVIWKKKR
jgi:hypothetical protein